MDIEDFAFEIAGTSIGSVIGAFYAQGYSSTDVAELIKRIDIRPDTSANNVGRNAVAWIKFAISTKSYQ